MIFQTEVTFIGCMSVHCYLDETTDLIDYKYKIFVMHKTAIDHNKLLLSELL